MGRAVGVALALILCCAATGAWAEDGQSQAPKNEVPATPLPDGIIPPPFLGYDVNGQLYHTPEEAQAAARTQAGRGEVILEGKVYPNQAAAESAYHAAHGTTPGPLSIPGEPFEKFIERSLDDTARRETAAGRPTYRTESDDVYGGLASFFIGEEGRQVTKEEFLRESERSQREIVERAHRQARDMRKEHEAQKQRGITPDLSDEVLSKAEAEIAQFEQEIAKQQAERRERLEKLRPTTLISTEQTIP